MRGAGLRKRMAAIRSGADGSGAGKVTFLEYQVGGLGLGIASSQADVWSKADLLIQQPS